MKTPLTLDIEKALRAYDRPEMCGIKINKRRGANMAFEVPVECGTTAQGLIDCVEICEYFGDYQQYRKCSWSGKKLDYFGANKFCLKELTEGSYPYLCDATKCRWNSVAETGKPKILVVCYEIKISFADFKSPNGHNFIGNCNYYVVPSDLCRQIEKLVPAGIGLIAYYDGKQDVKRPDYPWSATPFKGLRRKTECTYRDMTDEEQKWLILSVLKKRGK